MSRSPLLISASLWSADLANLESELRRMDPLVDRYHIDVADGTYADLLLFFPDLVAAVRAKTKKPLEVHLIMRQPERWLERFVAAGADSIEFYPDATDDPAALVEKIHGLGKQAGISLAIEHPPALIAPLLGRLETICVLGTGFGVKGVDDIAPGTEEKIRELVAIRARGGHSFEIQSDGAIRRHTVPRLRAAGADSVVPGSLLFRGDAAAAAAWLRSL